MRTKPVTRDEVRFNGRRITTLPADSVRGKFAGPAIGRLWAPLLRSLNRQRPKGTPPIELPHTGVGGAVSCLHCKRKFFHVRTASLYCSDLCARRERLQAIAWKRAEARAGRKCAHCGDLLDSRRSTMRFCSARCRVAAHRRAR
jgi:hypothetical protein